MSSHEIARMFVLRRKGAAVDSKDGFWSDSFGPGDLGHARCYSPSEAILLIPWEGWEYWPVDVICAASADVAHLTITVGRDGPPNDDPAEPSPGA